MGEKNTDMAENSQCRPGSAPGMQGAEPPGKPVPRRLSRRGCRGRQPPRLSQCRPGLAAGVPGAPAPGKINQKSPPSPRGKGVGGMGAEKQTNGKVGRRPTGHTPRRTPERHPLLFHVKHPPLPCSVSRETSPFPAPFHVKHPPFPVPFHVKHPPPFHVKHLPFPAPFHVKHLHHRFT